METDSSGHRKLRFWLDVVEDTDIADSGAQEIKDGHCI
jgi:hypothetical protein